MQKKKMDQLSDHVLDAQYNVEQLKANVNSVTLKLDNFKVLLSTAEALRDKTSSNKKLLDEVLRNAQELMDNSETVLDTMGKADSKTQTLASEIKDVLDKLIYSAEMINKMLELAQKMKATNPLISDELISLITKATNDANNSVALTLTAINSVFEAQSSNILSQATVALVREQSLELYEILTGTKAEGSKPEGASGSLKKLLHDAYSKTSVACENLQKANKETANQLNRAKTDLAKAEVTLQSLQAD